MESGTDSPHLGAHRLGPHVVGQRVVVRRILPERGPTGGPAFTDVLGTCLAWDPCVVQPEAGPPVTIPLDEIVSGKPVPPRPSVRHRVSARDAESHAIAAWPDVERVALGEWELRYSPTVPKKRTNSCLAMGAVPSVREALASVVAWYGERGRPPLVQVEAGSPLEESVRGLGWTVVPGGDADFLLAPVSRVRRLLPRGLASATLTVDGPRAVAVAGAAHGAAAYDRDWLMLHGLLVDPAHRRQGLARAVVAELLDWGAELGATTAWLHVETTNDAALALYEGLGFERHHGCRYYAPPG